MDINPNPQAYNVPHNQWRPSQLSAIKNAQEALQNDTHVVILELPTGSGKSAIPTYLGHKDKVVVLVHSLGLLDQYERKYGFSIIKGRENYDCVNVEVIRNFRERAGTVPTAADCPFEKRSLCPNYEECPYVVAKEKAFASNRMACTYSYSMVSPILKYRHGILVCDEAHILAEAIVANSSIEFSERQQKEWSLPPFPCYGIKDALNSRTAGQIRNWLFQCSESIGPQPSEFFPDELSKWRKMGQKIVNAVEMLEEDEEDFYLESSTTTVWFRGKPKEVNYLSLRPFSARKFTSRITSGKDLTVLMSATIGDSKPLAEELGFSDYQFFSYPHPVPANKRPIYDLGFERMTWDNLQRYPTLPKLQAIRILSFIESLPSDWRGIVLTSSNMKLKGLREHLKSKLNGRVYEPPETGPAGRIDGFLKDEREGGISIDLIESWGTGLDLFGAAGRFVVIAGIAFKNAQTDPFERARSHKYGAAYSFWQSYMSIPQAAGRVSRGEIGEDGEYELNVCALADGSATTGRAMKSYPQYFKDAIVKF